MAKKSSIEKNARRAKLTKQLTPRRARLKAIARDRDAAPEDRFEAQLKLVRAAAQQLANAGAQPLLLDRAAARLLPQVQAVAHRGARAGLGRPDPRHDQVELVRGGEPCR